VYARITSFRGTGEDLDRGIAAYREQVLPYIREVTGFRGHAIFVDREAGRAMSITLWSSEESLHDYEATADRFRTLLAETWQTPVTGVETYDVALFELPG
jgi:heme-degrading monooxygenase HmoA